MAQDFLWGGLVPFAVWNFAVRDRDVEGVVDQVVFKDPIVGGAGGERRGRVNLREERHRVLHLHRLLLGPESARCREHSCQAGRASCVLYC